MPSYVPTTAIMHVRRHQPTRLEGFVDASFAFAVTLVVISIGHVPASVAEMLLALNGLPAFAACFLVIARIWLAHRDWSRHYDIEDATGATLSLILVFVVLVYVYPLRMLFELMFLALSEGRLADGTIQRLQTVDELRAAYLVFGIGFGAIAAVFVLLFSHAVRCADRVGLDTRERRFTRMKVRQWAVQLTSAAVSLALAAWMPMRSGLTLALPGLAYLAGVMAGRVLQYRCLVALSSPGADER